MNNARFLPDVTAVCVVIAATVAATHWAGSVITGSELVGLYGISMGYVFGRNTPSA